MYGYIYKTTNLINGKIYIGQHTGEFTHNYKGSGIILKKAFDKYGKENFCTVLIDIAWDKQDLDNKEIFWISFLCSQTPNVGYNVTRGGQLGFWTGMKHSDITKTHLSKQWDLHHRRKHTPEELEKIRIGNTGKYVPPEVGRKISESNKGRIFTNEHKKHLSESHIGYKQSEETKIKRAKKHFKKVQCVETGQVFESVIEANNSITVGSVIHCLRGYTKTAGGYHWQYYIEEDVDNG